MKFFAVCGCGMRNRNLEDWTAHFKYGTGRTRVGRIMRAFVLLMRTRVGVEW